MLVQRPRPRRRRGRENGRVRARSTPRASRPASVRRGRFQRPERRAVRVLTAPTKPIRPLSPTPEVCRSGQIEARVPCRGAGAASGPAMRDELAEMSSGVRTTGSDRGAPRPTAMAISGDVRVGDEAGRPSGGVETALPHHRRMDTRPRAMRSPWMKKRSFRPC